MAKHIIEGAFNQSKRFSAIFFDLDNTLIATRKADAKACNKVKKLKNLTFYMDSSGLTTFFRRIFCVRSKI